MASGYPMHYQFNVKVVHTLTHLILPGHPTLPFEGFRGKYSVGQAHTYPCGQVYDFDRREGVARPESKHQIIIIIIICIINKMGRLPPFYSPTLVECGNLEDSVWGWARFRLATICTDISACSLLLPVALPEVSNWLL